MVSLGVLDYCLTLIIISELAFIVKGMAPLLGSCKFFRNGCLLALPVQVQPAGESA